MRRVLAQWRRRFTLVDCRERLLSAAGGFIGVFTVLAVSAWVLDEHGAAWMALSIGATSVLLFAVPHGQLSQPWAVFGGQVLSAVVGVTCAKLIAAPMLAGAAAVCGAIFVMYHLRCLHPPGGATALAAVLGGEQVRALGYGFVLTPVLTNVVILLAVAVALNWPFAWRRYPLALAGRKAPETTHVVERVDVEWALRRINSFIDVSEQDLARIMDLAVDHARRRKSAHGKSPRRVPQESEV